MLDRPWPMNSWSLSSRWPERVATARAIATASVRPITATAAAGNSSTCSVAGDRSGSDSGGSAPGSAPTVSMRVRAAPSQWFSATATRLPASMATIMYGQRGARRRASMPAASVTRPTSVTQRWASPRCSAAKSSVSWNAAPRGTARPKKFFTWLAAMRKAAPAVKPTITVCEMKLTSAPSRARPMASCMRPTSKAQRQHHADDSASLPGSASGLSAANTSDRDRRGRTGHQVAGSTPTARRRSRAPWPRTGRIAAADRRWWRRPPPAAARSPRR